MSRVSFDASSSYSKQRSWTPARGALRAGKRRASSYQEGKIKGCAAGRILRGKEGGPEEGACGKSTTHGMSQTPMGKSGWGRGCTKDAKKVKMG